MRFIFLLFTYLSLYAESSQWTALFHDNSLPLESYLSGDKNLTKELEFSLNNVTQENICSYPARYYYLNKKYDLNISFEKCDDLNRYIADTNSSDISLIFVSSFLSSPSSFFGHGLLKFNKKDNPFFSQTVSYAAEVPSSTGFFKMISSGVSGEFSGTITVAPYFKLLESYNVMEQRNIEEYKTNLNEEERTILMLHTYELLLLKNKYKFFSNNCATELLWLLNVARPSISIMDEKKLFDTPYSIIKTAYKKGLLSNDVLYRDSLLSKMNDIYFSLTSKEKEDFEVFKSSKNKKSLNFSNKVILLTNLYYDFMFKKYSIVFEDYNEIKELASSIKNIEAKKTDILLRNESKLEINSNFISLTPALLNREYDYNKISEISLEFMKIGVNYNGSLEMLNLFEIQSNNLFLPYKKDPSWRIYSGLKRTTNNELVLSADIYGGITLGDDSFKVYSLLGVNINSSNDFIDLETLSGLSYWYKNLHVDYVFSKGVFNDTFDKNEISLNYILTDHIFKVSYDKENFVVGYIFKF